MTDKWTAIWGGVIGLGLAALGYANPAVRGHETPKADAQVLADGKWASQFTAAFDKQLAIRDGAINAWTAFSYGLFREGRDGVLPGRDGWLFSREEYDAPRLSSGVTATIRQAADARQALESRGIHLLVVIVPAKARIYGEATGRYAWPDSLHPVYDDLILGLGRAGVPVVDLRPTLLAVKSHEPAYFHTDTHWTPAGAQAAAGAIAQAVRAHGGFSTPPEADRLQVSTQAPKAMAGDLLNFIPLGPWFEKIGPAPDRLAEPVFTRSDSGDDEGGLLGDAATPALLVGTSYSADERWGFANDLEQDLGVGLVNAAEKGEGPFLPMQKLLTGGTLDEARPEWVIWEIPERYVWMNLTKPEGSAAPK
ncbi:MAG: hypothetical protein QM647_02610 [Asticcacaulis sp.]|uniref:alginate O-acetyltransferase AlgX-related protein n=1 Tax=Asticcacaulis sp. TaxID=1872648 RepID=UPI0039E513AA